MGDLEGQVLRHRSQNHGRKGLARHLLGGLIVSNLRRAFGKTYVRKSYIGNCILRLQLVFNVVAHLEQRFSISERLFPTNISNASTKSDPGC